MQTTTSTHRNPADHPRPGRRGGHRRKLASIALLADLDDHDWTRPTDCAGWTVR